MNGTIISWTSRASKALNKEGEIYIHVYIRTEDNESRSTYLDPKNRNYSQWLPLLKRGQAITNLSILKSGLVDADSNVEALPSPQMDLFSPESSLRSPGEKNV